MFKCKIIFKPFRYREKLKQKPKSEKIKGKN